MKRTFTILSLLFLASCNAPPTNITENAPVNRAANSVVNTTVGDAANAAVVEKKDGEKHKHQHTAPRGGTLVAFGGEFAHLELVLDEKTGKLSAYALDGEAENPARLKQTEIVIVVVKPAAFSIKLNAVENSLTGETVGDTSEFAAAAEQMKNLKEFDAKIVSVNIKGREFKNVEFNFPQGNEEH